jgi:outer membrane lipoprotein
MFNHIFAAGLVLALSACATAPRFDTTAIDQSISPQQAVLENHLLRGKSVLWGGVVINAVNLERQTQFEILAYPLSSSHKPLIDKTPVQRFLSRYAGYLETSEYAPGRLLTVSGELQENSVGKIGESDYVYPVVEVGQLHLWPKAVPASSTQFHFGVGIMFHN